MTPLDRVALADALASASAETLREDADTLARLAVRVDRYNAPHSAQIIPPFPPDADTLRRLAALALACAELSEAPTGVQITTDHTEELVASVQVWGEADICAPTLPAALAALLKGDQ